jgi:hypothetical protein
LGGLLLLLFLRLAGSLASSSGTGSGLPTGSSSDGSTSGGSGGSSVLFGIVAILLCWVLIGSVRRYRRHSRLAQLASAPETLPVPERPTLSFVFARLRSRQSEIETVYGDYLPFVGAGVEFPSWTLCTELTPASAEQEAVQLSVPQMHAAVAAAVGHLASGSLYPGDSLHRVTVRDRLFRTGLRAEFPHHWFGTGNEPQPHPGEERLHSGWVAMLDNASHERLRHYIEVRAEIWEAQVVATVFLRVQIQGQQLYVEAIPFVLPPVAERYREVEWILPPEPLIDGPIVFWRSLTHIGWDLWGAVSEPWSWIRSSGRGQYRQSWYQRMIGLGHLVDHAPRLSVREIGSEPKYQQQFQRLDVARLFAAVTERVGSAVVRELKLAGYDTSAFERAVQNNTYINNGVRISGNATVNGPTAAGNGASAQTINTPAPRLGT